MTRHARHRGSTGSIQHAVKSKNKCSFIFRLHNPHPQIFLNPMQNQMWIYIYLKFILLYRRSKHWFIYEPVVLGRCVNTLAPASVTQTPIGKSSLITFAMSWYFCKILSQTSGFLITFRVKCVGILDIHKQVKYPRNI